MTPRTPDAAHQGGPRHRLFSRCYGWVCPAMERSGMAGRRRQLLVGLSGVVTDPAAVVAELHRVVRPGGELRFIEHVRAPSSRMRRVQRMLDVTVWPRLAGGCHTHRDTLATIEGGGFDLDHVDRFHFPEGPQVLPTSPHVAGIAVRSMWSTRSEADRDEPRTYGNRSSWTGRALRSGHGRRRSELHRRARRGDRVPRTERRRQTTTLRILLALVTADAGTATFDGQTYRDVSRPADIVGAALDVSAFPPRPYGPEPPARAVHRQRRRAHAR